MRQFGILALLLFPIMGGLRAQDALVLENQGLRLEFRSPEGSARLVDKSSGEVWTVGTPQIVLTDRTLIPLRPSGQVGRTGDSLRFAHPSGVEVEIRLNSQPPAVEYSYRGGSQSFIYPHADIEEVQLLHGSLAVEPGPQNYYAIPSRLGVLLPAAGDTPFTRRMNAYWTGRGYSMAMMGAVKNGSALLVTWDAPYTDLIADYTVAPQRQLTASLALRATARRVRLQPIGKGGYVEIAKAYRPIARQLGYLKTLAEKARDNPAVERSFGAADFKPFVFSRSLRDGKENLSIDFSFDEAAQLAEHYRNDLGIDRAMFVLAGWIRRGYDNQHPDILPAAPEIGGNEGLIACSRRVKALGYLFGLHDNYQDLYPDAPSWSEDYLIRNPDGSFFKGGRWAGGQCWIICPRKSLELARRPQNIPSVRKLFAPDLYFIDCVYANPLRVCVDPKHPVTKADDMRLKQELSDYVRQNSMLFGSEEGFEYGVAHSDYFEGMMAQKTRQNAREIVIPLFELVYGDAIPIYSHQGDRARPDDPVYILGHILYAEMPVYYFGTHLYWKDRAQDYTPKPGNESRLVFAKGSRFSLIDQYIKNTYEVLSPLNRITALREMTDHRFLTADRNVEATRFGSDVEITVNYGSADYKAKNAVLPQYGFLVDSPTLVAYYARNYGDLSFSEPTLAVWQSTDGRPLASSRNVRCYRGFGDPRVESKYRAPK